MSDLPTQVAPSNLPRVTHYGTIRIGELAIDCVVLADETRGYVQRQLMQAIGFRKKNPGTQFERFLAENAPNALNLIKNSGYEVVVMPSGGNAKFLPAGILTEIVTGVIDAALDGTLHTQRKHLIAPCRIINRALAKTGEVALIDEATGYQYQRSPTALQDQLGGKRTAEKRTPEWKRLRHLSAASYKVMSEMLNEVRAESGKKTGIYHYANEALLVNWALTGSYEPIDRELLPLPELDLLAKIEIRNTILLGKGIEREFRKEILTALVVMNRAKLLVQQA